MTIQLRQENSEDYAQVGKVIAAAFETAAYSDHKEHFLVEKLRQSVAFIPELSIVAIWEGKIIGHILLTKIQIEKEATSVQSLALAPVSVLPQYQQKGIGGQLILEAHRIAKAMGFGSIVLLGHKEYYPRFGYRLCKDYGIELPFEAPAENCMVIELLKGALVGVSGTVKYADAFYD